MFIAVLGRRGMDRFVFRDSCVRAEGLWSVRGVVFVVVRDEAEGG